MAGCYAGFCRWGKNGKVGSMEALLISKDLLFVIASVIPMLIIASFLDGDAQRRLRHYPRNIQDYWISMIVLVLFGELLALV